MPNNGVAVTVLGLGTTNVPLPLPLVPAFAGATLHLQVAPVEFSAGGAITVVTSSNRLSLTLGVF